MALIRVFTIIAFLILSTFTFDAQAQNRKLYKGQYHRGKAQPSISLKNISKNELITLFLTTGYATYYGDLCDGLQCFKFRPQLGVGGLLRTNYLGKRLSIRTDIRYFRLYSDDVWKHRNLNFRSNNFEFVVGGQFDFYRYEKMMRRRTFINPYITAGVGLVTFNPYGQQADGSWVKLRPLETEHVKYGSVAFLYTAGFGLKFRYSYKWNFMVEGSYRYTTTDYIDDVSSQNYPASSSFSNAQAAALSNKTGKAVPQDYRGDPKQFDGYFIFSAGVTYTFTKNHKPRFHNDKTLLRKN